MTIGDRIKQRRQELGFTQEMLAQKVAKRIPEMKFSRVSLSNVELGIQNSVKDKVLLVLMDLLQCNAEWLVLGKGSMESDDDSNSQFGKRPVLTSKCPVLTWNYIKEYSIENAELEGDLDYYACPVDCGPRTFVLNVHGDSMMPRFLENDLIFVDPDLVKKEHGKFVIAQLDSFNDVTFKQLQLLDGKHFLTALNPSYPADLKYINAENNCKILGTVVAHVKPI
ncbi:S24 family peptidase [Enterovibrio norvegicus]|uniref:S24 family peptidase n=1 Tax=Enterovibrio norvegicus TaxID=188144 RepID=UPI0002D66D56|nr:S24 family peptidase [Enterovibrio norvegicus]OEF57932.1 phage repressor protein [Enterovibrio norvegicus]